MLPEEYKKYEIVVGFQSKEKGRYIQYIVPIDHKFVNNYEMQAKFAKDVVENHGWTSSAVDYEWNIQRA